MSDILDNNTRTAARVQQENLPGAGGVLALGILSIVFAGLVGLILGLIGLNNAKRAMQLYESNPDQFTESSYSQVKGGRVCAIIGTSLSAFALLIVIIMIVLAASLS